MRRCLLLSYFLILLMVAGPATATPRWMQLPPTPTLPKPEHSGYAAVNGIHIWYAVFGHGQPVILLHGGLANSNYWGNQVPTLAKHYQVIVMDSRGHGRSTRDNRDYNYDLMASDVIQLMDYLRINKAAVVGWSDGAIVGLDIAIHYPQRLSKLFAYAANSDPSGVADHGFNKTIFTIYTARAKTEYQKLSATPTQFDMFLKQMNKLWKTQPHFTKEQLNAIKTPTWVVDGDHDEAVTRENIEYQAAQIPNAGLLLQAEVNHFAFMQDPQQFNDDMLHFLQSH